MSKIIHTVKPGEYPSLMFQNVCGTTNSFCNSTGFSKYKTIGPSWRSTINSWCDINYWTGDILEVYCPVTTTNTLPICESTRTIIQGDTIYFTIDDGPTDSQPRILKALSDSGVKATFFDTAVNAYKYIYSPLYLANTLKAGHFLASHGDTHYIHGSNCNYNLSQINPYCNITKKSADMLSGATKMFALLNEAYNQKLITQTEYNLGKDMYFKYSRLPCTNSFETNYLRSLLPDNDISDRLGVLSDLLNASTVFPNFCRPVSYGTWNVYGWDTLNNNGSRFDTCSFIKDIENAFKNPHKSQKVIVLFHTWDITDDVTQLRLTNVLTFLKKKGYQFSTINSY